MQVKCSVAYPELWFFSFVTMKRKKKISLKGLEAAFSTHLAKPRLYNSDSRLCMMLSYNRLLARAVFPI